MSHRGPLPDSFVETLFTTLLVAWGNAFQDQYKGLDMALIRADWARQLGGYFEPEADDGHGDAPAIRWALEHLPERPVNVMGFRKLCGQYLSGSTTALPAPRGPIQLPPAVRQEFERLREPPSEEPEAVRVARRYIELHDRPEATPREQELLAHYRRVLQRKGAAA